MNSSLTGAPLALTKRELVRRSLCYGAAVGVCSQLSGLAWAQSLTLASTDGALKPWIQLNLASNTLGMAGPLPPRGIGVRPDVDQVTRLEHWTKLTLGLVVKYQQNPLRASRILAYLHVGLHDAWAHVMLRDPRLGSQEMGIICAEIASHRAACLLLEHFYPNETPGQFAAQFATHERHGLELPPSWRLWAHNVGAEIALNLIERSLRDGAGRVWPIKTRPADFPGIWQATFPMYAVNPAEGFASSWQPWIRPSSARYNPPVAFRPGSVQHQQETAEVVEVFKTLTPTQKLSAERWNLEAGSVTPAGVWIGIALDQLKQGRNQTGSGTLAYGAQAMTALSILSAVSVAMHDAFIACWKIKFRDWSERPITAVRRTTDANFSPLLVTPGFPAYVSGHATISAAAARVLAGFWPEQQKKLQAMAQDAANSRLWGGIHFRSDNEEGLKLGTSVGTEIVSARTIAQASS